MLISCLGRFAACQILCDFDLPFVSELREATYQLFYSGQWIS